MNLKPEEISSVIKEQIKNYSTKFEVSDTGTVIQVAEMELPVFMVWKRRCRVNFLNFQMRFTAWY